MKKQLGLIVLAGTVALASLATAQVPAPPAPPAPAAAPEFTPAAPPAPPAPAAPIAAQAAAPQAPPAPAKPPKPARAAEAPKPAEAPTPAPAPEPPQPPPPGRERGEPDPVNIQFKVTVTAESASAKPTKRVAILTVSNGTGNFMQKGMLRAGNSVPVASTSFTRPEDGKETPAPRPLTSYNYRAVGLNVDVEQAIVVAGNRVRAQLNVEFSGVDEKTGPGTGGIPPSFPTFSQRVSLYLDSGKPVLVAQSTDMATGVTQMVEVQATIQR